MDFLFGWLFKKKSKSVKIICCGLDNSGKTTILNHLKPQSGKVHEITPTVGFSVDEFSKNNLSFTVFDVSGHGKYRKIWENFYADCNGVIFVIDSSDRMRIGVAKDELQTLLEHKDIKTPKGKSNSLVPILFFANKQDLPKSLGPEEITELLKLNEIQGRSWTIVLVTFYCFFDSTLSFTYLSQKPTNSGSNALTGDGIEKGVKWISSELEKIV